MFGVCIYIYMDVCCLCVQMLDAFWVVGATQAVQTSTKWMQSWERRWWLFGRTYRRRHWTCWSRHTRVSSRKTEHSDVRVSDHQLTKRTASPSQCHSLLRISWSGYHSRNTQTVDTYTCIQKYTYKHLPDPSENERFNGRHGICNRFWWLPGLSYSIAMTKTWHPSSSLLTAPNKL